MQSTRALKWFWPFMGVAALAATTIIAYPSFASKAMSEEPQFRMLVKVSAYGPQVETFTPVTIEPSCILVKGKRPASMLHRLATLFSRPQS